MVPALKIVFAVAKIVHAALVNVDEVALGKFKLLCLPVLEVLDLVRVLVFELRLDVIVGVQHTVHVLLGLLLGVKQTLLKPVDLVLLALYLVFEVGVFPAKEGFVLLQQVNLTTQAFIAAFNLQLGVLETRDLLLQFFLAGFEA